MYTRREALPRPREPFFLVEGGGHSAPARESFQDLQKQSAVPPRWISLHITCTHYAFKLPQAWSRSGWRRCCGESQAWSHRGWRRWRGETGCILRGPNGPCRAAYCYLATARNSFSRLIFHSVKTASRKLLYTPFAAHKVPWGVLRFLHGYVTAFLPRPTNLAPLLHLHAPSCAQMKSPFCPCEYLASQAPASTFIKQYYWAHRGRKPPKIATYCCNEQVSSGPAVMKGL